MPPSQKIVNPDISSSFVLRCSFLRKRRVQIVSPVSKRFPALEHDGVGEETVVRAARAADHELLILQHLLVVLAEVAVKRAAVVAHQLVVGAALLPAARREAAAEEHLLLAPDPG